MKQPDNHVDEIFNELWSVFYENSDIRNRQGDVYYNAIDTAKHQLDQYYADFYRNKILEAMEKELHDVQIYTDPSHQKMSPFIRLKTADKHIKSRLNDITAQFNSGDSDGTN